MGLAVRHCNRSARFLLPYYLTLSIDRSEALKYYLPFKYRNQPVAFCPAVLPEDTSGALKNYLPCKYRNQPVALCPAVLPEDRSEALKNYFPCKYRNQPGAFCPAALPADTSGALKASSHANIITNLRHSARLRCQRTHQGPSAISSACVRTSLIIQFFSTCVLISNFFEKLKTYFKWTTGVFFLFQMSVAQLSIVVSKRPCPPQGSILGRSNPTCGGGGSLQSCIDEGKEEALQ